MSNPHASTDWSDAREAAFAVTYHDCVRRTRKRAALGLALPSQSAEDTTTAADATTAEGAGTPHQTVPSSRMRLTGCREIPLRVEFYL